MLHTNAIVKVGGRGKIASVEHPVIVRFPRRLFVLAGMAIVLWGPSPATQAQSVLEENFKYSGWASGADPMRAKWQKVSGRDPEFLIPDGGSDPDSVKLSNNIFYLQPENMPKESFTLSAEVLFTSYSRSLWIGVLREDGSAGRAAMWGAALENQYAGQGWVQIRAVESDPATHPEAGWDFNTFSAPLQSKPITSGKASSATAPPFARMDLHWDADAKRWTLHVNGRQVAGVADEFDLGPSPRVYFGGGSGTLFKKITLTAGDPPP